MLLLLLLLALLVAIIAVVELPVLSWGFFWSFIPNSTVHIFIVEDFVAYFLVYAITVYNIVMVAIEYSVKVLNLFIPFWVVSWEYRMIH